MNHEEFVRKLETKRSDIEVVSNYNGNKKRVSLKCKRCGHVWQVIARTALSGTICSACLGAKVIVGTNDMQTLFPEVAEEWHPTKNGKLIPSRISYSSGKRVWWKCKVGHEWESKVSNRTINERKCPYCTNRKVLAGFNDLTTTHPELVSEWHPIKNGSLLPQQVTAACKKKIWWQCKNGHEWETYIYNRKKEHGCPYCTNRKILVGYNDLATTNPDLASEWHPTKNESLTPQKVAAGSHKIVLWVGKCGHEWEAEIKSRSQSHECPYCTNQRVLIGFNDLSSTHPELASEWHPIKNGTLRPMDVTSGSTKNVWWQCKKGHEWNVKISSRTYFETGCPKCSDELHTSFPEQAILFYMKKHTEAVNRYRDKKKEIDIYLPQYKIGIEHNGDYYHQDRKKDQKKVDFFVQKDIRIITVYQGRDNMVNGDIIEYKYSSTSYDSLEWAINEIFKLIGWQEIPIDVSRNKMEIYAQYVSMEKENSLLNRYPEISKEWHPTKNGILTPFMVSCGSSKRVWWKCKKGHEWEAIISSRVKGNKCPICSNKKVLKGVNDLATTHPELAKEWHPTKNEKLTPQMISYGSGKKVWWQCKSGHEWERSVNHRSYKKSKCPYCSESN